MKSLYSKHAILTISHNNADITACHLDGFRDNHDAFYSRLEEIEAYFKSKPDFSQFLVWFNIDENELCDNKLQKIAEFIGRNKQHFRKTAFIGLGKKFRSFQKLLNRTIAENEMPMSYFVDANLAKDWLVGKIL